MSRTQHGVVLVLVVAVLLAIGAWRISLQRDTVDADPVAGYTTPVDLQLARRALAAGDTETAIRRARAVLAAEPLQGPAFAVLAQAMQGQGSEAEVLARYRIAARRAPRDPQVRSWLATRFLEVGDYAGALRHLDALLTVSPASREALLPVMAQLAQDPAFADALAVHLGTHPRWRTPILRAAGKQPDGQGDRLFEALRRHGGLAAKEEARWINGMLGAGRWGSAYARWVGGLPATGRLPLLHNGGFEDAPTSSGFDWHVRRVKGVIFRNGLGEGSGEGGARLTFLGRAVGDTGLGHPLLLAPGRYRLALKARAPELRAEQGLEWRITCADGRTRAGAGARIAATQRWSQPEMTFDIPAADCEGQWLRLMNVAPAGVAQAVRGEIELDDVRITRLDTAER